VGGLFGDRPGFPARVGAGVQSPIRAALDGAHPAEVVVPDAVLHQGIAESQQVRAGLVIQVIFQTQGVRIGFMRGEGGRGRDAVKARRGDGLLQVHIEDRQIQEDLHQRWVCIPPPGVL